MNKFHKNILSGFVLVGLLSSTAITVNAAPSQTGQGLKNVSGYKMAECYISGYKDDAYINHCSKKSISRFDQLIKHDVNFGKASVLTKNWNTEMNFWEFAAINKTNKLVHFYPRGIRAINGDMKNASITFNGKKKNMICTKGTNVILVGTPEAPTVEDTDKDIDYCTVYDDQQGFGNSYKVDAKTRKVIEQAWYL